MFGVRVGWVFRCGFVGDTWALVVSANGLVAGSIRATYGAGVITNLAGAIATVVFLVPIAHSWPRMFRRIKEKYQIGPAEYRPSS